MKSHGPSTGLGKLLLAGGIYLGYTLGAILCFPFLLYSCCFGDLRQGHFGHNCKPLPEPKPLPRRRIDLGSKEPATQPKNCHFFHKLPLELRRAIYEEALGGRRVRLSVADDRRVKRRVVRARAMPDHNKLLSGDPISLLQGISQLHAQPSSTQRHPIPVALLRVCRQVYIEAHAIVFQCNTFDVLPNELDLIVRCGLGETIALPHIRHLRLQYWYSSYSPLAMFNSDPQLRPMFQHLAAMSSLTNLTFEFVELLEYNGGQNRAEYDPNDVLDSCWGRGLLGVRSSCLRRVGLNFVHRENILPPEFNEWKAVEQRIGELMVGENAQKRYKQFLKDGHTKN